MDKAETVNAQMQVLELHELDVVEAGMAVALWGELGNGQEDQAWSTFSVDCSAGAGHWSSP